MRKEVFLCTSGRKGKVILSLTQLAINNDFLMKKFGQEILVPERCIRTKYYEERSFTTCNLIMIMNDPHSAMIINN